MKYFTLISLTILAVKASSASTTSNEPSPINTFLSEAFYGIKSLFTPRKNLIKARLELPKPLTADKFVSIAPTENICVFPNKSEFWKTLFAQTEPGMIEKIIFCPEAITYLADLKAAKLVSSKNVQELRPIISALLLRRETLVNKYSQSYVDNKFVLCYNTLWAKLNDNEGSPYWPCNGSPCTSTDVETNFNEFTKNTPACQEILSDQLTAYAKKVAEITKSSSNPAVTSAVDLRAAILENLNDSPHLSVSFAALYDTVNENNKIAAAEKIQAELADVKAIIEKQAGNGADVYAKAVEDFKARLENRPVEAVVDSSVKSDTPPTPSAATPETKSSDNKSTGDASDNKTSTTPTPPPPPPTKTDKEPTKTTN